MHDDGCFHQKRKSGNSICAYDGLRRRKSKTVNGTTTVFITDAANREVMEYDGTSGAILRWYAYGLGANDVLNRTDVPAATRTAYIPDIQGSIVATLSSSGTAPIPANFLPVARTPAFSAIHFVESEMSVKIKGGHLQSIARVRISSGAPKPQHSHRPRR